MMESSDWIALGAALLALFALIVSIYEAKSNKPRLRVSAYKGFQEQGDPTQLVVVVVNFGRQPTMITHVSVVTKGEAESIGATGHGIFPHLLEVGRVATFALPM